MDSVRKGAKQAVETCLKIKKGERVVIITDKDTLEIASAIIRELPRGSDIQFFVMEDFGQRPLNFPKQIGEALGRADVGFCLTQDFKGEIRTFRGPMLEAVEANKNLRFAHMAGVDRQIMREGMCGDYDEISRLSNLVYQKVQRAREIGVRTARGTDILAQFSPKLKWIVCNGLITKGHWSNLPDGEVFTCPANVNGLLAVDGCLGDFFDKKYGLLTETPVLIAIRDGRAVPGGIACKNEELKKEFTEYLFGGDENSSRVGEFALGTNTQLNRIIGNLLQDEKFPGVHVAFGGSYPEETDSDWDSDSHVDCVIQRPTVSVDGEIIMREGKYVLKDIRF